jgi:ATP-dependent protease ClpP protease subunit
MHYLNKKDDKKSIEKGETTFSTSSIEANNNIIYFASDVNNENNFNLNKQLREKDVELRILSLQMNITTPNIYLHISSFGGSILSAFSTVDCMKGLQTHIHTYVDGYAASAGTIMSVVGKERYMGENSYMLIHQLSNRSWGNYEQLKDDMKNCDVFMKRIKKIYEEHTKIPKNKLKEILKHDLWWDAKTCLKYGLIDDIV